MRLRHTAGRFVIPLVRAGVTAAVIAACAGGATSAMAQQVVLRLHYQLPAMSPIGANFLTPWAKKVEAESNGRIKIELYPSMQLGGTPPQLYDQVKDGVVDITWAPPGYTAGRFPKSEVFELPFISTNGEMTSPATWEFFQKHLKDEFKDVQVLAFHTNGPFLIHAKGAGVRKLEDMKGLKLRGPSRIINKLVETLGATPVGIPVPSVPDALAKGVIDGTLLPWEVTTPLRIAELVNTHTGFSGSRSLCVVLFVFAMNKAKYESLPPDLRKVIDDNSGATTSVWAGKGMDQGDLPGLEAAKKRGNDIVTLDVAETARWRKAAESVIDSWIADMKAKGIDGKALVDDARALIAKSAGPEG
jgi:TRAP-type C4-dicarboxylate transport system substrate-binding protein